ncbi:MAG: zincin-like metallopeptidase domain-containing protein [Chloroflexi bacterium]|nr:zincin-like metallopeptidase domain-containing protein [Chloroflexota bacterium]
MGARTHTLIAAFGCRAEPDVDRGSRDVGNGRQGKEGSTTETLAAPGPDRLGVLGKRPRERHRTGHRGTQYYSCTGDGCAYRLISPEASRKVNRAYYRPSTDTVHLPPRAAFDSASEFYSTTFHELGHSTGHKSRLDRHGMETGIAPFGSPTYSREELVAEFTSAFLCNRSGIDNTIENSTAYIQGWARAINKDKRLVVTAASQGQKAADYILGQRAQVG